MQRSSGLRRTRLNPVGKKTARDRDEMRYVRERLVARSRGRCEASTPVCVSQGSMHHHLVRRSQGGDNTLENGIFVCDPCHRYIHDHPEESYIRGWLRHPEQVEVATVSPVRRRTSLLSAKVPGISRAKIAAIAVDLAFWPDDRVLVVGIISPARLVPTDLLSLYFKDALLEPGEVIHVVTRPEGWV